MQKAIFLEEAYKKGILPQITEGYIFSIKTPNFFDMDMKLDPFLLQMVSYSGLKAIYPIENGIKFQAQGKYMYALLEPANYSQKHVEPTSRSQNSTAYMPYRFSECEEFFSKDMKFRVLMPKKPHECFDSFTIDFPEKGDICVLYFIFDKENIANVVIPFIQDNISFILKAQLKIRENDSKMISKKFMEIVKNFHLPND